MKLCEVLEETAEVELDLGKMGPFNITYRPNFYTAGMESIIEKDAEKGNVSWLVVFFHGLLTKWELEVSTEEEAAKFGAAIGEMVPLTVEALSEVPSNFLAVVFNAFCTRAKGQDEKNASSSVN